MNIVALMNDISRSHGVLPLSTMAAPPLHADAPKSEVVFAVAIEIAQRRQAFTQRRIAAPRR